MFQALMDRIDEEVLKWIYLYQPVPADAPPQGSLDEPGDGSGTPELALRSAPRGGPGTAVAEPPPEVPSAAAAAARFREPALSGIRHAPRNLTYNDPSQTESAFAKAERPEAKGGGDGDVPTVRREGPKVGRNDPCPCGSGKKYKKCHGSA
jgi:hypothetical protein